MVNPGDYPGSCDFPFSLDLSGKGKTIELPDGSLILTSPGLDVTVTNLDKPENQATFNITGSVHQRSTSGERERRDGDDWQELRHRSGGWHHGCNRDGISFVFDANGNLIQPQTGKGQRIDVCELLS